MPSIIKRGQAAGGAAVLLAVIAGLIIMFIILIPPAERAKLLEDQGTGTSTTTTTVTEVNLLEVSPGRVDYLAQKELEHPLPVINIYTKAEAKILDEKNIANVKKSLFSEEVSEFSFPLEDLNHTDNLLLSFKVKQLQGRLRISLNGEEIFNAKIEKTAPPVTLPKNKLLPENKIIFAVSSPGLAFWRTNEASLEQIKIVGEVTNLQAQSSKNTFLVSETEKNNLEKVVLKFQPHCKYEEAGKLTIEINGKSIYEGVPDCDLAFVPIELSPEAILKGENQITFRTEKGTYLLSHVTITSKLKEVEFPTYYFELSHEQYQEVQNQDQRARLRLEFVDVVVSKEGDLIFNGHSVPFDTKEATFIADVSDDVVPGNNAIKIKPDKTLEIRELRVDLVK